MIHKGGRMLTQGEKFMIDRAVKYLRGLTGASLKEGVFLVPHQLYNDLVFFEAYTWQGEGLRHRGYGLKNNGRLTVGGFPVEIDPKRWETCQECGEAFVLKDNERRCRACSTLWGKFCRWLYHGYLGLVE